MVWNMIDIRHFEYFMGINSFPQFDIEYFNIADSQDFVYTGRAIYDLKTKRHKLLLPSDVELPEFLVFHELTHILDMEKLGDGNRTHDFCLTGYMEYHASQVELMTMMGATTIQDALSFSMEDAINCSEWSVRHYLDNKLATANTLILDSSHEKRCDGLGALFNFWGLKSVCSMYSIDFKDDFSYREFLNHMSTLLFMEMRDYFTGWIDDVDKAIALYSQAICSIAS